MCRSFLGRLGTRLIARAPLRQATINAGTPSRALLSRHVQPVLVRSLHYTFARLADQSESVKEAGSVTEGGAAAAEQESVTRALNEASRQSESASGGERRPFQRGEVYDAKNSIHVAGLNYHSSKETVEKTFSEYGNVVSSKLLTTPEGLSRGVMFIKFDSSEAAARAIAEMNGQELDGRRIFVDSPTQRETLDRPRRTTGPTEPTECLFVGNMSYSLSNEDLNDLFRSVRNVLDVRVAIDRRTGQPRGFAHADFIDVASATEAKRVLHDKVVKGRALRVDYAPASTQNFRRRSSSGSDRRRSDETAGAGQPSE